MFKDGYALLIGVDENKVPSLALPTVKNDTSKLRAVLTHPERCGYPEENVKLLAGKDATRANILDGLDWLKQKLSSDPTANQTALIYYSGHGHSEPSGESFLVPYDFRFPLGIGGLPGKDFAQCIDDIRPRRLLVILDCCHAGSMNVKDLSERGISSGALTPSTPGLEPLTQGAGRAVLSSSRGDQRSWLRADGQMSIFTYHLIEALTGYVGRPSEPEVLVTEVMDYVARKVPESARSQHNVDQQPDFRFSGNAFPIAQVLGGKGIEAGVQPPDPLAPLLTSTMKLGTVTGNATNVEVERVRSGEIRATTEATVVEKDAKLVGVKLNEFG